MTKTAERINITPPASSDSSSPLCRQTNLDVIRIFSFVLIPCVHFFLYTGFYSEPMTSPVLILLMCLRNFCLCCIPLFMMLTGYLQSTKSFQPDKKYYSKIFKFLVPYLIVCVLTLILNALLTHSKPSVIEVIKGFTTYTGYTWYIEMYLGVFLLIPFLNKFYNTLTTKKQEKILLGILIGLSLLPTIINNYSTSGNFLAPPKSSEALKIIPNFYTSLYPFTFYFTGAYLRKHKDDIKLSAFKRFLLLAGAFILFSAYCIARNYGRKPSVFDWISRNSLMVYVVAVLTFLFFLSFEFQKMSPKLRKFLGKISDLTFSAYICSYLADKIAYRYLNRYIPQFTHKLLLYPVIILSIIIVSLAAAFLTDMISKKVCKLINRLLLKNKV